MLEATRQETEAEREMPFMRWEQLNPGLSLKTGQHQRAGQSLFRLFEGQYPPKVLREEIFLVVTCEVIRWRAIQERATPLAGLRPVGLGEEATELEPRKPLAYSSLPWTARLRRRTISLAN
jgi:hypothetical protein